LLSQVAVGSLGGLLVRLDLAPQVEDGAPGFVVTKQRCLRRQRSKDGNGGHRTQFQDRSASVHR